MPAFEVMDLYQRAVYWQKIGDNREGSPLLAAPVEIAVRWVDAQQEAIDAKGRVIRVDATIVAGSTLVEQSLLWKGTLKQWNINVGVGTGYDGSGLMQLVIFNTTPDIKNRNTRWSGSLMRFTDFLPNLI